MISWRYIDAVEISASYRFPPSPASSNEQFRRAAASTHRSARGRDWLDTLPSPAPPKPPCRGGSACPILRRPELLWAVCTREPWSGRAALNARMCDGCSPGGVDTDAYLHGPEWQRRQCATSVLSWFCDVRLDAEAIEAHRLALLADLNAEHSGSAHLGAQHDASALHPELAAYPARQFPELKHVRFAALTRGPELTRCAESVR